MERGGECVTDPAIDDGGCTSMEMALWCPSLTTECAASVKCVACDASEM